MERGGGDELVQKKYDIIVNICEQGIAEWVLIHKFREERKYDCFNKRCEVVKSKIDDAWKKM